MTDTAPASDRPVKIILEPDVATELVALLVDEPGDADETLLDAALDALQSTHRHIPSEDQVRLAAGGLVAVQLDPAEVDIARTLIEDHDVATPGVAQRMGDRLRSRILRAERRRAERGQRRHLRLVT